MAERDALKEGLDGWHSRFLDCEVERDAEKEHVRQCVANIAKLIAERDAMQSAYGKSDEICDGLLIENAALRGRP
jgi:hypothetical protein